uniref:Cilia- and flagella-associated protein 157 n=1 Tax=Callorhinchus milii TaxID=7868 RepID=A0A4W3GLQ8_CALMI
DSLTRLSKEMEDIISFLKKCLDQRADEIADLNDKLVALDQAKEVEKDAYETQLSHLRHECQDAKDQLTTENIALAGKLAAVEEFRLQKEQLMANFATLEEELKKMDHDHKGTIYDLERRAVIDKDRLKKEMISRLNTVATEFRRVSKTQMSQTTKRTIRENVSISIQLGKMSDKSLQLIKQNDEMRKATMTQWTHLHIMEENERKLIKKNSSNRKVAIVSHFLSSIVDALPQNSLALKRPFTESLSYVDEELKKTQLDLKNKLTLLAEESERRKRVEEVLSDAAYALKDILLKSDSKTSVHVQRSQMMHKLLLVLNTAACIGLGPPLGEGPGIQPHYRQGDLGLVPRAKHLMPNIYDKVGFLSRTTRLGLIRTLPKLNCSMYKVSSPM